MAWMWWNLNCCRWMVACADSVAEVELENRCFLGVIPVKDREEQTELVRESQQAIIPIWRLWDKRQKEAELSISSSSACDTDVTVLANPKGEHPAKGSAQGRDSQSLVPLLSSLPCWGLCLEERDLHLDTVANPKSAAFETQLTVLLLAEVQVRSWWESQAAHLHSYVTGPKSLLC